MSRNKETMIGVEKKRYNKEVATISICSQCLSQIGKGIPHPCTRQDRRDSLSSLVRNSSNKTKGRVLSSQLKEIVEERNVARGEQVMLTTSGLP